MNAWLRPVATGGCELTLHIQPGATSSEFAGEHGGALKLRIRARAVEGAANAGVADFLAEKLGISRREVKLLRGEKSRRKTLWVSLSEQRVLEHLALTNRVIS